MFSDEEKKKLLDDISEIRAEQHQQNQRLDILERAIEDNSENNQMGMRTKVNVVYETVQSWQDQVKGAKFVVAIATFIFTSGLGLLLYNAFTGGS